MGELPDSILIEQYLEGDMKAFETLMERYKAKVFSYILRMVRNRGDAEDLFQETFFKVVRELPTYQEKGRFKSFIFQIAHNACLDHLKRLENKLRDATVDLVSNQPVPILAAVDAGLDPEQQIAHQEQTILLHQAITSLPDNQREVVIMRYYSDLSFKEIAEIINCPLNTVLGRMHYALKKLKGLLGESS